jgi:hypothetical protein
MSGINGDWAALSSEHERLIATADDCTEPVQARHPARWAELASQRERLVELADPPSGLAGSAQQRTSDLRLAVRAA